MSIQEDGTYKSDLTCVFIVQMTNGAFLKKISKKHTSEYD